MGMSTHIVAFVSDNDPEYQKQKAVLDACLAAGIEELPKETAEYFGQEWPDAEIGEARLEVDLPVAEWKDDMKEGYEVKIEDIPAGVYKIRFYNSW